MLAAMPSASGNSAQSLKDLLAIAAERHGAASGRHLAKIAQDAGHDISHTTVNRIRSGEYLHEPSSASLHAIAYLAGVPVKSAYIAAAMSMPAAGEPYVAPTEADWLDTRQRNALTELIRAVVNRQDRLNNALAELNDEIAAATDSHRDSGYLAGLTRAAEILTAAAGKPADTDQ